MIVTQKSSPEAAVDAVAKQAAYTEERRRYWDDYARTQPGWDGPRRFYRRRLAELYRFAIPPGSRVLETGMRRRRFACRPCSLPTVLASIFRRLASSRAGASIRTCA